jgi:A/G-specific adenine glycosylase
MSSFHNTLINWYRQSKRDLPWRETSNPYMIWISEIILQQTRVNQGLDYYTKFLSYFPDIKSLVEADEHEVLKLWQGLGYYSRARNLHQTAKTIVEVYKGSFPTSFDDILKLKGIGQYTASAIASIAFNQPYPAVDGNVYRFLARYFNIIASIDSQSGKKEFRELAGKLIDKSDPGIYNQAIMEFGALQCVPVNPQCDVCVFRSSCQGLQHGMVLQLPSRTKKVNPRTRYFNYILFEKNDSVFLQKRTDSGIWKNLWQLPLIETSMEISPEEFIRSEDFVRISGNSRLTILNISRSYRHALTHQLIFAKFYHCLVTEDFYPEGNYSEVLKNDIIKYAIPRLIEIYLSEKGFLDE